MMTRCSRTRWNGWVEARIGKKAAKKPGGLIYVTDSSNSPPHD